MIEYILLIGVVMVLCLVMEQLTNKLPIPSLLLFLLLGMIFGIDGLFGIPFDNYEISETICSVCLIFIMFYGGFGTSFKAAKPVVVQAGLLATVGVVLTAGLTGAFVHLVLKLDWLQSLLIGSVIASTDAVSVFGILRREKLNLKDNTASLLEVESGSNDPVSYMLTVVLCTLMSGSKISVFSLLMNQLVIGIIAGLVFGKIATSLLKKGMINKDGKTLFVLSVVLLTFALSFVFNGNGYLSVYLCGILMGNTRMPDKKEMVHFFDTVTNIAQMMIFFLLGLLVTPSELPEMFFPAFIVILFLTFVSRPLAVFITLLPFKASKQQIGLVSFAGLRGVASIVFAITAVLSDAVLDYNLYNLVFCIVLMSISIQGSFLPFVSNKLNMIDNNVDVSKTFNDYQEESSICFIKIKIGKDHPWEQQTLSELPLPSSFLVTLILRKGENVVPKGNTVLEKGDLLVIAAQEFTDKENLTMKEVFVDEEHKWVNQAIRNIKVGKRKLIVMIKRGDKTIIPDGTTMILNDDVLVIAKY